MDVVAEAYFCHLFQASMAAHFHPLWFHELTPIVHVALFFTCIGICVWRSKVIPIVQRPNGTYTSVAGRPKCAISAVSS